MSVTTEQQAGATAIREFRVEFPDEAVDDLRRRIADARLPEEEPVEDDRVLEVRRAR